MTVRQAVFITRSNGAYLIQHVGELVQDLPDDLRFEAASSLRIAKRIAKEGAESFGYGPPFRWITEDGFVTLEAVLDDQ